MSTWSEDQQIDADEPGPPEVLERSEVQENIDEALRKTREGDVEPGMTADELRTGPEASDEPGDLRAQPSWPMTYYMALPIRLAREEDGGPAISMHCTMRHHSDCTGFTQFRGKLCPCDCDWCDHEEAA